MNLAVMLDQAGDDLLRAQTANPPTAMYDHLEHALVDVMHLLAPTTLYSSLLAEALFNMRAAMTASETKGKRPGDLPDVPALDPEVVGRCPHADPTGDLAIKTNAARTQHRDLSRAIAALAAAASRCVTDEPKPRDARTAADKAGYVHRLCLRWLPRHATLQERAETERANDPDLKGCTSCARTESSRGVKRWEPIYRNDDCRWCWDWRRKHGGAPPLPALESHHAGKRVMVSA